MSDSPESNSSNGAEVQAEQEVPEAEPERRQPEAPKAKPARPGRLLGVLALLLALGALGLAARPWWPLLLGQAPPQPERDLGARVESNRAEISALQEQLRAIVRDRSALDEQLDRFATRDAVEAQTRRLDRLEQSESQILVELERRIGELNTDVASLRTRIETAENNVGANLEQFEQRLLQFGANLDGASEALGLMLALTEVQSLFSAARERLHVLDEAEAALRLWQRGVEKLERLSDPRLVELKRLARADLASLRQVPESEVLEAVRTLSEMAEQARRWPATDATATPVASETAEQEETEWMARLGGMLDRLVTVESIEQDVLSPAELDLERAYVSTSLQTAALALARDRHELAGGLVEDAAARVAAHFDQSNPEVSLALAWLADFEPEASNKPSPDLGATLDELTRLLEPTR